MTSKLVKLFRLEADWLKNNFPPANVGRFDLPSGHVCSHCCGPEHNRVDARVTLLRPVHGHVDTAFYHVYPKIIKCLANL